jgi:CheY-like chemotaxis protein
MKTILLIEDNDEIRENTAEILELSMYNVYTAPNGKAGVEKAIDVKKALNKDPQVEKDDYEEEGFDN